MPKKSTIHDVRFEAMLKLLKDARLAKGLTQEELSSKLGQHRIYINKVESGQRRLDIAELFDLCEEVGLSIHELIQSTFQNNQSEIEERSPDYILGFSNGYLQGRGHESDSAI
jgi:transcriptional regulator with XRE-family HTH domain